MAGFAAVTVSPPWRCVAAIAAVSVSLPPPWRCVAAIAAVSASLPSPPCLGSLRSSCRRRVCVTAVAAAVAASLPSLPCLHRAVAAVSGFAAVIVSSPRLRHCRRRRRRRRVCVAAVATMAGFAAVAVSPPWLRRCGRRRRRGCVAAIAAVAASLRSPCRRRVCVAAVAATAAAMAALPRCERRSCPGSSWPMAAMHRRREKKVKRKSRKTHILTYFQHNP
jgi:hypothetical protein